MPVKPADGVTATVAGQKVTVKGTLGKLSYSVGKYVVLGKVLGARRSVYDPSEW